MPSCGGGAPAPRSEADERDQIHLLDVDPTGIASTGGLLALLLAYATLLNRTTILSPQQPRAWPTAEQTRLMVASLTEPAYVVSDVLVIV